MTNDFDLSAIRKQLDALRAKHGAGTPIGHRCSNLIGQLRNYEHTDNRAGLAKKIAQSMADIERLSRAE